ETIPGMFDSLIAKVIISGRDRREALERARRALAEFEVEGMPTVLPFHQAVLEEPAFTAENGRFDVHTRWIETEFDHRIPPYDGPVAEAPEPAPRERITVEVGGKRLEVVLPAGLGNSGRRSGPADRRPPRRGGG